MMSRKPYPPLTWTGVLDLAATPQAVVEVVRDFMATWTPGEIAALPVACVPPAKFTDPEDVVLYAYTLADYRLRVEPEDPGVHRMATFFAEATRRVTFLMGQVPPPPAANSPELR